MPAKKAARKPAKRHALRVSDALEQMERRRRTAPAARKGPRKPLDLDFIP